MSYASPASPYFLGRDLHTFSYHHHLGDDSPISYPEESVMGSRWRDVTDQDAAGESAGHDVQTAIYGNCEEDPHGKKEGVLKKPKGNVMRRNHGTFQPDMVTQDSEQSEKIAKKTCRGKSESSVFESDGQLFWRNIDHEMYDGEECCAAVYHEDIRGQLIKEDAKEFDSYAIAPARGTEKFDVTSNCDILNQHLWKFDSALDLVKIVDGDGNHVFILKEKPDRDWEPVDTFMYHRGLLVLDSDDQPVLDLPGIPRCLSSKVEGARLEAFKRTIPWVQTKDIRARMPHTYCPKKKEYKLLGLTAIRLRQSRFRDKHELTSWDIRRGTLAKNAKYSGKDA